MRSLAQIQEQFVETMIGTKGVKTKIESQTLQIYRRLIAVNHESALEDVYPVCKKIVGERYFSQLAWRFLCEHPPTDSDLNTYGDIFALFLTEQVKIEPTLEKIPYIADCAAFEWGLYRCSKKVSKKLKQSAEVKLTLAPYVELCCSAFPIAQIWQAHQEDDFDELHLEQGMYRYVVWLVGESVHYTVVQLSLIHI